MLIGVRLSAIAFPRWKVDSLALPLATAATVFQLQDFLRRYFFTRGRGADAFNQRRRSLSRAARRTVWLFVYFRDEMDTPRTLWVIAATAAIATMLGLFSVERLTWDLKMPRGTTRKHWNFSKCLLGGALMGWTFGNLFIVAAGSLLGCRPSAH